MDRILALQRLTFTSSFPGFEPSLFEETVIMSTVSGICATCSSGLAQPSQTQPHEAMSHLFC